MLNRIIIVVFKTYSCTIQKTVENMYIEDKWTKANTEKTVVTEIRESGVQCAS